MKRILFILLLLWLGVCRADAENVFLFPVDESSRLSPAEQECEYGQNALAIGDYEQAAAYFREGCRLTPPEDENAAQRCLWLADALYRSGKYAETEQTVADFMLRRKQDVALPLLHRLQMLSASAQMRNGKLDEAMRQFMDLSRETGDRDLRHAAFCRLAQCYERRQEWSKALELLETRRSEYPQWDRQRAEWQLELARSLLMAGKSEAASAALQELLDRGKLEAGGDRTMVQLLLVQALAASRKRDEALALYRGIETQCPAVPDALWRSALEELCTAWKDKPAVAEGLCRSLLVLSESAGDCLAAGAALAESLHANKKSDEAQAVLRELEERFKDAPGMPAIMMRRADWMFEAEDYRGAAALYIPLAGRKDLTRDSRYRVLMHLAQCHSATGDGEAAAECYRLAAQSTDLPASTVRSLRLAAQSAEENGDFAGAVASYREAARYLEETLGVESLLESALLLRQKGRTAEAVAEINRFIAAAEQRGNSERVLEARVQSANWQRELAGSDKEKLKKAEKTLLEVAKLARAGGNEPALAAHAYLGACDAARYRGDVNAAIAIVNEFMQLPPPPEFMVPARRMLVMLAFQSGDIDRAVELGREYLAVADSDAARRDEIAMLCGDSLAADGPEHYAEAIRFYMMVGGESTASARYECALLYSLSGEGERAAAILAELTGKAELPRGLRGRVWMLSGDLLAGAGEYAEAIEAFDNARSSFAEPGLSAAASGRKAEMQMAMGDSAAALATVGEVLAHYDKLTANEQQRALFIQALALQNSGNEAEAIRRYQDLCIRYNTLRAHDGGARWEYYSQAVWKLAELQGKLQDENALRELMHRMEEYSRSGLPRHEEAESVAADLRQRLDRRKHK